MMKHPIYGLGTQTIIMPKQNMACFRRFGVKERHTSETISDENKKKCYLHRSMRPTNQLRGEVLSSEIEENPRTKMVHTSLSYHASGDGYRRRHRVVAVPVVAVDVEPVLRIKYEHSLDVT